MIFIDAREGLSGDMLLSAMIGLLGDGDREAFLERFARAAENEGMRAFVLEVEDAGDRGLSVAYSGPGRETPETGFSECASRLAGIADALGGGRGVSERILNHLFEAESEAHGLPKEEVHLHEIGRPQAMLNMAGIGRTAEMLEDRGAGDFVCSTISTGGGFVVISHGTVRIPPPASAILLRGLRHTTGDSPGERATPTGIAAVKALARSQSDSPPEAPRARSVGFGTKRFAGRLGRTVLTWSRADLTPKAGSVAPAGGGR